MKKIYIKKYKAGKKEFYKKIFVIKGNSSFDHTFSCDWYEITSGNSDTNNLVDEGFLKNKEIDYVPTEYEMRKIFMIILK